MLFFNRIIVLSPIEKNGSSYCTVSFGMYGTAESKSVITVNPKNYIFPHGRTYESFCYG